MIIKFDTNRKVFVGEQGETYKIYERLDKGEIRQVTGGLGYRRCMIAVRDLSNEFKDPDELKHAISQMLSETPCDGSLCQICDRTGALAGCPKQTSAIYKTLSEREDPVEGWDADPTEDLVRVKLGDIFIPTMVRGWFVCKCPLFKFGFGVQATFEFFKIARMMMLRYTDRGEWEVPERSFLSRSKDLIEDVWKATYPDCAMYCERDEEEEEE